jgi:hypothetical protein
MFVDDEVEVLLPPLPLPLLWSKRTAVPGTSSVMSPPSEMLGSANVSRRAHSNTARLPTRNLGMGTPRFENCNGKDLRFLDGKVVSETDCYFGRD